MSTETMCRQDQNLSRILIITKIIVLFIYKGGVIVESFSEPRRVRTKVFYHGLLHQARRLLSPWAGRRTAMWLER